MRISNGYSVDITGSGRVFVTRYNGTTHLDKGYVKNAINFYPTDYQTKCAGAFRKSQ